MKSLVLHTHTGLGDHIITNGMVHSFTEDYDKIYIPHIEIFSESINTNYMVSQQLAGSANVNYFNPSLRFEINPYSSLLANYTLNGGNTINLTIYHRFVNGMSNIATDTGFTGTPTITNFSAKNGGLFVNLNNQSPTF
jgi:hypothetical protein